MPSISSVALISSLYFALGFLVISVLLVYTQAKRFFDSGMHAVVFAFITMITMLAGYFIPKLFSYIISCKSIIEIVSPRFFQSHLMLGMIMILINVVIAFFVSFYLIDTYKQQNLNTSEHVS